MNISEAAVTIQLRGGILTVKHGDTGETLISRPTDKQFWQHALWPCLDGHDIKIRKDGHEVWLQFDNPSGASAAINLTELAMTKSPITRAALLEWCVRASARCPCIRCEAPEAPEPVSAKTKQRIREGCKRFGITS